MQTLGERLEEARKRKGISIREAAEATKIRGDYLQKFEANSFDFDLPPLYIRGFLRTYAKFLEFDPQRLVAEFDTLMADEGRAPRRETRENYGRVEIGGGESAESAPRGGAGLDPVMLKYALFGGGALVIVVVVVLLINVFSGHTEPRASAPKQTATENTPERSTLQPLTQNEGTFTLIIAEPTRVKVAYEDNSVVFLDGKYPMNRGETRSFNYSRDLIIVAEHPDRIRMEINGAAVSVPDSVKPMTKFRVPVVLRR
ncbi:MAG: helix-turn-helix domain-containing protein [Opitutae bacterium]|nr:helix-turn-helix domain-containing protein [Opitutae bacterium]